MQVKKYQNAIKVTDALMEEYNFNKLEQLDIYLGLSEGAVAVWRNRKVIPIKHIDTIISKCNVSREWVKTGEGPMFETANDIGGRLKELRGDKTVEEVCTDLEFLPEEWMKWEQNLVHPGATNIIKIAAYFDVNSAWISTSNPPKKIPVFTPSIHQPASTPRKAVSSTRLMLNDLLDEQSEDVLKELVLLLLEKQKKAIG